jgi:enterochelin esterase family protein
MMRWSKVLIAGAIAILSQSVMAQQSLNVGKPESGDITPGSRIAFTVQLAAGDYVEGTVEQLGILVFASVLQPDGALLRAFPGPTTGTRPLGFVASSSGTHQIVLSTPTVENAARNGVELPARGQFRIALTTHISLASRLASFTDSTRVSSPFVENFRRALTGGHATADSLWTWVRQRGTPVIDADSADPRYQLVTFLWRELGETRNVLVLGSFSGDQYAGRINPEHAMRRIAGTDAWYLTLRLPAGARFTYQLSPNDPLSGTAAAIRQRLATAQVDPFNPRRTITRPGASAFDGSSIAELPGAVSYPWLVASSTIAHGSLTPHRVESRSLKSSRRVVVYEPAGDRTAANSADLVILFDENPSDLDPATALVLDGLIAARKLRPTIAVLVANDPRERGNELLGNPAFSDFLAHDLLPWVWRQYRVTHDPSRTVIGGASAGGLAAVHAALRHPNLFGKVLSQSGAFDWSPVHRQYGLGAESFTEPNGIVAQVISQPRQSIEFYLQAGVLETDVLGSGGFILEPTRQLRDVLRAKGYTVHYDQFIGGHDPIDWRGSLADGLLALLGR